MAVFTIEIPDFRFSGLYYPQIWQSLISYRRARMQELTDENPNEPTMQILAAFAAGFHYTNVLLDHVALETLMPTARLRESVRSHLLVIGRKLREANPAIADLTIRLAAPLVATTELPDGSLFSAEGTAEADPIDYELIGALALPRTDQYNGAQEDDGGVFTDRLSEVVTPSAFTPWAGVPAANDALYFGHTEAQAVGLKIVTSALGDIWDEDDHVWEYHDASVSDATPSAVAIVSSTLEFTLTNLLGTNNRAGSLVTVRHQASGVAETVASVFSGGVNKVITTHPGQSTPSPSLVDYITGVEWKEVPGLTEVFSGTEVTVKFTMPNLALQSRSWSKVEVNSIEAYWLRLRMVQAATTSPTITGGADPTESAQYILAQVTQGRSVSDDPAGTFDGSANQVFETSLDGVIDGSVRAFVDEGSGFIEYTAVDDFLSSASTALEFTLEFSTESRGRLTFGDDVNGKLPSVGATLKIDFRVGADDDGNVGAGEIAINKSSVSFVGTVTNPNPATGWEAPEGSTDESLAQLKVEGPASLRLKDRAVSLSDMGELALQWTATDGSKPVARADAILDGYGEKTVRLNVVGLGGTQLDADTLTALSTWFNGDQVEGIDGKLVAGTTLTAANYIKRTIGVTATVLGGDQDTIVAALTAYLNPTRLNSDGGYEHEYGDTVFGKRLAAEIFISDPDVENVPTTISDVVLEDNELPWPGTMTITVT